MKFNVSKEVAMLQRLTTAELQARYTELFGTAVSCVNREWLVKRIVWQMQARVEGGLSERARQRAAELATDAKLRIVAVMPPPPPPPPPPRRLATKRPARKPLPDGTVITRTYKGKHLQVRVLANGFEFEGAEYASLSALAQAITGAHWNGRLFFGLNAKGGEQ